jgi:hypothetical protein
LQEIERESAKRWLHNEGLRSHSILPYSFYLLIAEKRKDFINAKIKHHMFNQRLLDVRIGKEIEIKKLLTSDIGRIIYCSVSMVYNSK